MRLMAAAAAAVDTVGAVLAAAAAAVDTVGAVLAAVDTVAAAVEVWEVLPA
jgi:hypothetical protein